MMTPLFLLSCGLAILFHLAAFVMESFLWQRPAVRRIFRHDEAAAKATRALAFNQGFYNLCLALGLAAGLGHFLKADYSTGIPLLNAFGGTMIVAACALITTDRKFLRAALMQGLPPLVALLMLPHLNRALV